MEITVILNGVTVETAINLIFIERLNSNIYLDIMKRLTCFENVIDNILITNC